MPERSPAEVASYNILKRSCKEGAMSMFVPNCILLPNYVIVGIPIIVFTATYFPIPNEIRNGSFLVPKEY